MTFLLLLLSYVFQYPQSNSAKSHVPKPSSERIEAHFEANNMYVYNGTEILQLNTDGPGLVTSYENGGTDWIFAATEGGQLVSAKRRDSTFYVLQEGGTPTHIAIQSNISEHEIIDITSSENKIELLTQVNFSSLYQVTYDLNSDEMTTEFVESVSNGWSGAYMNNNRIRTPFSNDILNTVHFSTLDGGHRTFAYTESDNSWSSRTIADEEVADLAFDAYGEVYGMVNGSLHHIDLDSALIVPYSLNHTNNLTGVFSHINEPLSYGLGPKSQAFYKQAGEEYFGHVKITNRFESDLEILSVNAGDDFLQISPLQTNLIAPGESIYLSFEVIGEALMEIKTQINFQFQTGEMNWSDSVFVEGVVYEPAGLSDTDLFFYDTEASRFVDQNDSILSFPREISIASANSKGVIYAIAGNRMYELDPVTKYMKPIRKLFTPSDISISSFNDMAFDGEDTYYLYSSSGGFRSEGSSSVSRYNLQGERLQVLIRDAYVGGIAYSITRKSFYFLTRSSGRSYFNLHQNHTGLGRTIIKQHLHPVLSTIKDIFFDAQDDLYMICANNEMSILCKVDLEMGTQEVVDTLAAGVDFGISRLSNLPLKTDLVFQTNVILDVEAEKSSELKIFPNPVSNLFQIASDQRISTLRLVNLSGQEFELETIPSGNDRYYRPMNAAPGVYLLQMLLKEGEVITRKLLIQ
ncbi:MAG: T9SS type A sorting domain-containing protein [Cytophagales bacterium]|nr:T9SS type A sorting domain-containing protein [Cytophagales bacterium]